MNVFFARCWLLAKKYGLHAMLWCELDNIRLPADKYLFDYPQDVTSLRGATDLHPNVLS